MTSIRVFSERMDRMGYVMRLVEDGRKLSGAEELELACCFSLWKCPATVRRGPTASSVLGISAGAYPVQLRATKNIDITYEGMLLDPTASEITVYVLLI